MYAIIGGGFGLYGYLPALLEYTGGKVLLESKRRTFLDARVDLQPMSGQVEWRDSLHEILRECDGVVIAVPPFVQPNYLRHVLRYSHIQQIVLEKPIAVNPAYARQVIERMKRSTVRYRVGYTFLHTNWYQLLKIRCENARSVAVMWSFQAHHFSHSLPSWKKDHFVGGGPLRFYGIHLIAVVCALGFDQVVSSVMKFDTNGDATDWHATFENASAVRFDVHVITSTPDNEFSIHVSNNQPYTSCIWKDSTPFGHISDRQVADSRIPHLMGLLTSFDAEDGYLYDIYDKTLDLWTLVESVTRTGLPQGS